MRRLNLKETSEVSDWNQIHDKPTGTSIVLSRIVILVMAVSLVVYFSFSKVVKQHLLHLIDTANKVLQANQ